MTGVNAYRLWRSEVYLLSPHDTPSIPKTRLLRPVDWPAGTEVAFSVTERGAKLGNYKVVNGSIDVVWDRYRYTYRGSGSIGFREH